METSNLPYIYEIEPTNACPYSCYMCPRGKGKMMRPVGFMQLHTFASILKQMPPAQKILRLHHFGEPILHQDIASFIRLTRAAGIIPVLSLNPASLTIEIADNIIDNGVGMVCFSLDSLNSQKLFEIRGIKKSVQYCLEMIDYFIKKSRSATHPAFKIIQMVSLTINSDERNHFLSLKEKYPEDDVYVYVSGNYGFGDMNLISETDRKSADNLSFSRFSCSAPFDDIVVLWNGDVVLCCYDYDGYNIIGNVNQDTIKNIWDGHIAMSYRESFIRRKTERLHLCSSCYLAPHKHIGDKSINMQRGYNEEIYILTLYPSFKMLITG